MSHKVFLARPFLAEPGSDFQPYEGEASGVLVFGAWTGKSVSLDGVTVIAPGFRSLWIWDLWSRHDSTVYELVSLEPAEARSELEEIRHLLSGQIIEGKDRMRWSYAGEGSIGVFFSEEERETVLKFFRSGIDSIGLPHESTPAHTTITPRGIEGGYYPTRHSGQLGSQWLLDVFPMGDDASDLNVGIIVGSPTDDSLKQCRFARVELEDARLILHECRLGSLLVDFEGNFVLSDPFLNDYPEGQVVLIGKVRKKSKERADVVEEFEFTYDSGY